MRGARQAAIIAAMLGTAACGINAQGLPTGDAARHMARCKVMYAEGRYAAAEIELNEAVDGMDDTAMPEEARMMMLATRYRLGKCDVQAIDAFLADYPANEQRNLLSFMAGDILFRQGEYEKAVRRLGRCDAFALPPADCEEAIYAIAVSCQKTGRTDEAKINYATLKETSARYGDDARFNLGYILYSEGNYDKAFDEFDHLRHSDRFSRAAMTYVADIYYKTGDYDHALMTADRLLDSSDRGAGNAILLKVKGASLYAKGDMARAAETLDAYRRQAKSADREALYMLGMACYATGANIKAAEALEQSADADDALSQNAWLHIGLARLNLADTDRARLAFERASVLDFDQDITAQALYNYGLCINRTAYSPFNESVKVFSRLLNEYPGTAYSQPAATQLAEACLATSDYAAALDALDGIKSPTAQLLGIRQKLLFRLGLQQFADGDYTSAAQSFTASAALGGLDRQTRAEAYFWRGESRYRTSDMAGAETDWRRYIESAPDRNDRTYALAYYNLGYVYFKSQSYAKALNAFRQCKPLAATLPVNVRADLANRMGDCYYRRRDFTNAGICYDEAVRLDPGQGDYAMFQRAFILGLQKNYKDKIATIDRLLAAYPSSSYRDDAMFEKGRALVMMDETPAAIACYESLVAEAPTSPYARRAEAERAMLLYRSGDYGKAAQAYKGIITAYPGTDEAGQAARDLKALYVETNSIDDYFSFAEKAGLDDGRGSGERDSLTYLAAERLYMSDDKAGGIKSMEQYLAEFPDGAFAANAGYYAASYYYSLGDSDKALAHLARFADRPAGRFTEAALTMSAGIYYDKGSYDRAADTYRRLRQVAAGEEGAIAADAGLMRSLHAAGEHEATAEAATALLAYAKIDPHLAIEAHRIRALALTSMSRTDEALADWEAISGDTRNEAGAEARYRIAEILFARGDNDAAEAGIQDYIKTGTPHAYWMARSFLLLADIYAAEGRTGDARQYLLSLRQNYNADDDIAQMIAQRLEQLNNTEDND